MKILFVILFLCLIRAAPVRPSGEIRIMGNYTRIHTIAAMLVPFKGKPVYVDLWATWCEPCIEAFRRDRDTLYNELAKKGINLLYVSIDKPEQDSLWRETIFLNQLYGSHIRADKSLADQLTTLIWGAKDVYSIPHYLLFDKNGGLVSKDASPRMAQDFMQH